MLWPKSLMPAAKVIHAFAANENQKPIANSPEKKLVGRGVYAILQTRVQNPWHQSAYAKATADTSFSKFADVH